MKAKSFFSCLMITLGKLSGKKKFEKNNKIKTDDFKKFESLILDVNVVDSFVEKRIEEIDTSKIAEEEVTEIFSILEEKRPYIFMDLRSWYCERFHKEHHYLWYYWFDNTVGYKCKKCGIGFDAPRPEGMNLLTFFEECKK